MRVPESYSDRIAWGLFLAFVSCLVVAGPWIHPIEDPYGPEFDGYLARVDEFREGILPKDGFRPLLYPLLSTLPAELVDDTFLGAKLMSALAGGVAVLAAYYLGASLFGGNIALFGALLLATNRHFIQASFRAATDILFCAMIVLTILYQVRFLRSGRYRDILPVSFFFALSFFTRYVAVFFLPVLFGGFLLRRGRPIGKRLGYLTLFSICAILFLIPHFTLQVLAFGEPFHSENWRNTVLKFKGLQNVDAFHDSQYEGMAEVLTESPMFTIESWMNEMRKMVFYTFMNLNGRNTAGAFFTVFLVLGTLHVFPNRDPGILTIVCAIGSYLVILCFFWFFDSRIALPILPYSYLLISNFILGSANREPLTLLGRQVRKGTLLALLFLILNLQASWDDLRAFRDRHPLQEVEEAIRIQEEFGKDVVVLGTYWAISRYVDYEYKALPLGHDGVKNDVVSYLNKYREKMKEIGTTHLMVGKKTLMERPVGLLTGQGVPPYLKKVKQNEHVTVYEFTD